MVRVTTVSEAGDPTDEAVRIMEDILRGEA